MPIAAVAPRHPQLLTADQRIPSAEMVCRSNIKSSNSSCTQTTTSNTKKSISFYEVVSIRSTTHLNDMTEEEIDNSWYTRQEMTDVKRRMAQEVKHWVSGKSMAEANFTSRGLEFRTREGSTKRKANKVNAIVAVLDEQDLQKLRGITEYHPEGLRKAYTPHAERCLQAAHVLGLGDEKEAALIHKIAALQAAKEAAAASSAPANVANKAGARKNNMFKRLFAKKKAVMDEIKSLQIRKN